MYLTAPAVRTSLPYRPNGRLSHILILFPWQVVWITGADHGVGEQLAINLTVNGARVKIQQQKKTIMSSRRC